MPTDVSLECLYDDDSVLWKIYCLRTGQQCDFESMFADLRDFEKDKISALIAFAATHSPIQNKEISRLLRNGIYEFKRDRFRMPYFYHSKVRYLIVITHMFAKKRGKCPAKEIRRAEERRIIAEDLRPE